jgi:multidrug efflux pump
MSTTIVRDSSTYIQQSINEVEKTIIEACLFVILVIFIFTASLRSAIIPIVTIPLSLVSITTFMMFMGYSINTLTLLAAVLAIGMIVDDAIVVLENVHRHIEQGMSPFKAAIMGAREIRFAIISMTLTLAAVYSPLLFSGGLTGSLFREFAFVLAGVIIISGFIALTLSPMMCSKIMIPMDKESAFQKKVDRSMDRLMRGYQRMLERIIHLRFIVISCMIVVLVMGLVVLIALFFTSTLAPDEDEGVVLGMVHAPTASILEYTEKYTEQLGDIFKTIPESTQYTIINGFHSAENGAFLVLGLKPWNEREKSANQIISALYPKVNEVPGIKTMLFNPPSLPGSSGIYPVEFVIKTMGSYAELSDAVDKLTSEIEKNPSVLQVQSDLYFDKPEVEVEIDRNKANALGITMEDIAKTLNITLGTPEASTFVVDGLSYYVIPELMAKDMDNPAKINNLYMRTSSGKQVPLSNLVHINHIVSPTQLNHFQGQRAATLSMVLKPNYSTAEAIDYLSKASSNILPTDMSYDFSGTTRLYQQEGHNMLQLFLLALLFIYLLLSAQFESFRYPFIVLMTVPLALTGALAALFFTGSSLNIYTEIALVTLIGLISKHGILIVEFAKQLQEAGENIHDAIMKAASIRLRPILMTTAAMVLGAIPLILSSGAGANARTQIGIVIVSGMLLGTMLTLFLVPTFYTIFAKPTHKIKANQEKIANSDH